jgi:hypothetical protein
MSACVGAKARAREAARPGPAPKITAIGVGAMVCSRQWSRRSRLYVISQLHLVVDILSVVHQHPTMSTPCLLTPHAYSSSTCGYCTPSGSRSEKASSKKYGRESDPLLTNHS